MKRLDFIEMAVAGSSALFTQSCRNWKNNQMTHGIKNMTQQKVRVRHCITSTDAAAQRNVEHFKKAVAKMKAIAKSNPESKLGWIAQGEIHYKYCAGNHNIHRTGLFLPWHRAYLFFFEEICRQLLKEDNVIDYADFALPYWDWTKSPRMPDVFGETVWDEDLNTIGPPADWRAGSNFKWERSIKPKGHFLGDLQINSILNATSIYPIIGVDSFGSTGDGLLLSGPHSIVHNEIGGNMGNSALAALDPIFWLHHANIDRIWSKWMENHLEITPSPNCQPEGCGVGCQYPTVITNWLKKTAEGFYDVNGTPVNRQVLNLLDTFNLKHLGYCYDDCQPIEWSDCPQIQTVKPAGYSIKSKFIGEIAKMNESKTVRVGDFLAQTSENSKILKNLNTSVNGILKPQISSKSSSPSPSLLLIIEVEKPANPAISVRLFIDFQPDQSEPFFESPSYVATFSFFESPMESHHHGSDSININLESRGFIFDITDTILKLSKVNDAKSFTLEDATISIFPKLLNDKSSNGTENIKLISFRFDLAK